mmetsp:Transcript_53808/g.161033  ORF Transcript_53808/g.161033 Transcript_53808/m.161033 type:complete len:108 (-) Transcript_53808:748-1071(-)
MVRKQRPPDHTTVPPNTTQEYEPGRTGSQNFGIPTTYKGRRWYYVRINWKNGQATKSKTDGHSHPPRTDCTMKRMGNRLPTAQTVSAKDHGSHADSTQRRTVHNKTP